VPRWSTVAWWALAATAAIYLLFGLTDIPSGTPDNALAVTGQTEEQLAASQPQAYALAQASVRTGGVQLAVIGLFALAILVFAFRQRKRWAWWTLWLLPALSAALAALAFTTVAAGQAPAFPAYSGLFFAVLDAAALLVAAPAFFRQEVAPAVAASAR
jgi:hypothetical protein